MTHSFENLLNQHIKHVAPSPTLWINQHSLARQAQGQEVFKFGFGQSPFAVPSHVVSALQDHAHQKAYVNVSGLEELRERIADYHQDDVGFTLEKEHILVGPGSKMLLYSVLAAFKQASLLLPAPTWVSYQPQAELLNHRVTYMQCNYENRWRLSAEQLDATLNQLKAEGNPLNILILTYPGNPCGLGYSAERLEALAHVARAHQLIIISDEIYAPLTFNHQHQSISLFYPEGTIVTTGLSKWCGAGGWRLGVALIPPTFGEMFKQSMIGIGSEIYSCATSPVQYAAIQAYTKNKEMDLFLQRQRDLLSYLAQWIDDQLSSTLIRAHKAEGGFYLFIDFELARERLKAQGYTTSEQICHALLQEAGVALLPGSAFGMPPPILTARLAFVDFDGVAAIQALASSSPQRLNEFSGFNHLKAGIRRLIEWTQ
jgi:aspartate aminotransferase